MNESELKNIWKSYDQKLEESLVLNKQNAEEITKMKVKSFLASMKPLKIFTLLIGILWVGFVDVLIINLFSTANLFFLISAFIQVLLTKLSIGIYLYQVILIHRANNSEAVITVQENISRLITSTIWVTRLLFLQLPVWTTFYWNESMLQNGNVYLYIVQVLVTILFTLIAVWLFLNIKYENRDKKWFKFIFKGKEWEPIIKAKELLIQIEEYKSKETTTNESSNP